MRCQSLLFALLFPFLVLAQADKPSTRNTEASFTHTGGHVVIRPKQAVSVADFFPAFAKTLRTGPHSAWTKKAESGSPLPGALAHQRYAQEIDGLPVLGATLIVHSKNDQVMFATGKSYPAQSLSALPTVSEREAIRRGRSEFAKWNKRQRLHPLENNFTGSPIRTEASLDAHETLPARARLVFLDRQYPQYTGSLLLAYEIEIGPGITKRAIYIDARTGKLITSIALVAHNTVPGTVETGYYGIQNVMVEQEGMNSFRLVDSTRGIIVTNNQNQEITHTSSDFPRQAGTKGGMANDVFYGSSRFYDLLNTKFGWRGVDGQGEFLLATVSDGESDLVNAFWNGQNASFGGGSCHFDPLTTLDVVGHEFAHGVTQRTSNLVYQGQSGALNEGMSDIFGKALELYEQPNQFNWILGNRFADSEYAKPFRSMEDPNVYNKPKVVGGNLWNDGAGVHTNSGPLGHWFYLLVEGGSGTNDLGTAYNVEPVGLEVAFAAAFELNRDYLIETSGYQDAFTNCMLLVEEAYGINSDTYQSFAEAWKAIGLPTNGGGPTGGPDLAIFSFNPNDPLFCHPEDSVELTVVLSNRGDDLTAGTEYTLTARIDTEESVITRTLTEDFLGGEVEFFDVLFPISVTPGQYRAEITVNIAGDVDTGNDSGSQTAYVFQSPHAIEIESLNAQPLDCFAEERVITLSLINRGCEAYTGPVIIDLFDKDSTIVKTFNVGTMTLAPNEFEAVFVNATYDELEEVVGLRFDVPNDPLPEDNIVSAQLGRPRLLTNTGTIDFSNSDADRFVTLDDSRGHMGVVSQANREWLGTTGYYTTPFRLACLETETNLEVAFDLSVIDMCVDFENEATPRLAFDLRHLYGEGDPEYPGLIASNRGMSVSFPDGMAPAVVIDSRADGMISLEEVELPANHKGLVRFTMFNASGSPTNWETADPNFEDYDYTLIDNIRLSGVVNTKELAADFSILPNPARSYFTINTSSSEPLMVEVINSIGQPIAQRVLVSSHTFSTGNWPNGIYQVRLSDESGAQRTETLMVAR